MSTLVFQSTSGGQINLNGPSTASTFNIAVPATTGTIVTTGDTGTVSSTMLANSLSLVTPALGTPASGVMTNVTGLPLTTGVTGILPIANGGTGVAAGTGSGNIVFSNSPTISSPTISSPTISSPTINGTPVMGASVITSGTAVAATSGTNITFSGIPSWVKRITLMFETFGTSGASLPIVQLGTSGGIVSTSYLSAGSYISTSSVGTSNVTTGFPIGGSINVGRRRNGSMVITNLSGNLWVANCFYGLSDVSETGLSGGSISLGATLTTVRLTTVNGTDTFVAGSINILYE